MVVDTILRLSYGIDGAVSRPGIQLMRWLSMKPYFIHVLFLWMNSAVVISVATLLYFSGRPSVESVPENYAEPYIIMSGLLLTILGLIALRYAVWWLMHRIRHYCEERSIVQGLPDIGDGIPMWSKILVDASFLVILVAGPEIPIYSWLFKAVCLAWLLASPMDLFFRIDYTKRKRRKPLKRQTERVSLLERIMAIPSTQV